VLKQTICILKIKLLSDQSNGLLLNREDLFPCWHTACRNAEKYVERKKERLNLKFSFVVVVTENTIGPLGHRYLYMCVKGVFFLVGARELSPQIADMFVSEWDSKDLSSTVN
jgi:hypothetical protein